MPDRRDPFYNRAKHEGLRSRASYKLIEIQEKYGLLAEGDMVLEVGASPGGWTQIILEITQRPVIAVDTNKMEPMEGLHFIKGNIMAPHIIEKIYRELELQGASEFNVLLSDAMVKTSGDRNIDHSSSYLLCERVMEIADQLVARGGNVLVKQFQGDMTETFFRNWKKKYKFGKKTVTKASRSGSREMYMIFAGKKS